MVNPQDISAPLAPLAACLQAYRQGWFPMARSAGDSRALWCRPQRRGLLPLDDRFHLPRRLARLINRDLFTLSVDHAFPRVLAECAKVTPTRPDTWINNEVKDLFIGLAGAGYAHSLEVWQDKTLVGGLYGLHLGGVFFAESMFSRRSSASSVALVALVALCRHQGFALLDTQFVNDHLAQFGAFELADVIFSRQLRRAVVLPVTFAGPDLSDTLKTFIRNHVNAPRRQNPARTPTR